MKIIERIGDCNTMPELDDIRLEVIRAMEANNAVNFQAIQKAFIKRKNKLKRIPIKDRAW